MRKILSYGGGVNGVAMVIALMKLREKPDAILFADTGAEIDETYEYKEYFSSWLVNQGWPPIQTVTYKTKRGRRVTLEQEIIKGKTFPSVAFGFKTCSQKHKIYPQQKWVKYKYGKEQIVWFVGFDAGEPNRVRTNPERNYSNRYPLIELGWNREQCIEEIIKAGLKVPLKSACYFCSNRKKHEILSLARKFKTNAKNIEANATAVNTVKGLGRRFSWTDLIDGNDSEANKAEAQDNKFKEITGEDFEPVQCNCID